MERTATECLKFAETFGRSPAMTLLSRLTAINKRTLRALSPEANQLRLCISFWETRKVRGLMMPFFIGHNLHCTFQAQFYRAKLKTFMEEK